MEKCSIISFRTQEEVASKMSYPLYEVLRQDIKHQPYNLLLSYF